MTDAKATICYLNGLSLHTINEVEKILRSLPQKGTRCEVQMSKAVNGESARGTADVIASKSMQIRDEVKPLALSPRADRKQSKSSMVVKKNVSRTTDSSISEKSEVTTSRSATATTGLATEKKFQCKVLTDQVRVSPIVACNGVILELDVEVTVPDGAKKKLRLEIECPDFMPARIKIGNKWKKIV